MAGGADAILIPERPFDIDAVCAQLHRRKARGRNFSIVVVAEGAAAVDGQEATSEADVDEFGHERLGGIGHWLEREIESRTGFETRATVLGHVQRGGTPTAYDRVLATRFGLAAIDAVHDGDWGKMVSLRGTKIERVPLSEAVAELRTVPLEEYEAFSALFG
jgi:ATP-dependent phosphofructokinase / diphosphate-dependent phosphofructokinase